MKKHIKKIIPKSVLQLKEAIGYYRYDLTRFLQHSALGGAKNRQQLLGKIIERYHSIEKGLTMPEGRMGFGVQQMLKLITDCIRYIQLYGNQDEQLKHAVGVIFEYEEHHKTNVFEIDNDIQNLILELKLLTENVSACKQVEISREEYFQHMNSPFPVFAKSRASVRNYSSEDVSLEALVQAIEIAQSAPSACNRQTSRVYIYTKKEEVDQILKIQGGNRGFGHLANKVIVITAELGVFGFLSERNQAFVDGGIFAMNILYALHFKEIGACILNCSIDPYKDKSLRSICKVKESESFVAMISCGLLPEKIKLASSKRHPVNSILTIY